MTFIDEITIEELAYDYHPLEEVLALLNEGKEED